MLLGIACHPIVEGFSWCGNRRSVVEESLVEAVYLPDEVGGMGMPSRRRSENAVVLGLVASQQKHILNAQKLQVDEFVFRCLARSTATDDVGHNGQTIALLDGSSNGDGARPASYA